MSSNLKSSSLFFIIFTCNLTLPAVAIANQLIANGTSALAMGTYDTGTALPNNGYALYALNGGIITSNSALTLITGGNLSHAAYAQGVGSSIFLAAGSTIFTSGEGAKGVYAQDSATITVGSNSSIITNNATADGLYAFSTSAPATNKSIINATDISITTNGNVAHGAHANDGGIINLTGANIITNGIFSNGLYAIGLGNPTIKASQVTVTVNGDRGSAASSIQGTVELNNASLVVGATALGGRGAIASNNGLLTMNNGSILVEANASPFQLGIGVASASNSSVMLTDVNVVINGVNNYGAQASSGGAISINGGSVSTTGLSEVALYSFGSSTATQRSLINVANASITTSGDDSRGAWARSGGDINLINSTIETHGQNAYALYATPAASLVGPSAVNVSGGSIQANNASAIVSDGTTLNTALTNTTVTGNGAFLSVINSGVVNLESNQSTLNGSALLDSATGASSNISLLGTSLWNMSDNSVVTTLVNNQSTIHFAMPALNGLYKTLTVGDYVGINGLIQLNTFLHGSNSPSDLLVIDNNGSATGTTGLVIHNTAGSGALTEGDGILVVRALDGATSAQTAFSLASPVVAGPFEYSLYRSDLNGENANNWYLRSICPINNPLCSSEPPSPGQADYRLETKIYSTLAATTLLYGQNLIGTLHERVGQDKWGDESQVRDSSQRVWARVIGLHGKRHRLKNHKAIESSRYDYNFGGLQLGGDLIEYETSKGSRNYIGGYGAFGRSEGDVEYSGYSIGSNQFTAYSLGGYWTHYLPAAAYIDTVLQATFYANANSSSYRGLSLSAEGVGFAASVEGGYPFHWKHHWIVEPQGQLIYQTINLNDAHDFGAQIQFQNNDALAGRLGVRFANEHIFAPQYIIQKIATWFRPNVWRQFKGNPQAQFSSAHGYIPFQSQLEGTSMELNLGTTIELPKNTFIYSNVSYTTGLDVHLNSYNGELGFKVKLA